MTEITDAQLEQWAARAEPISRSSITASSESKFSVMDLAQHVVCLVDEVQRLRRSDVPEPTHLVASLSPATDPHEPDDARNREENHRGDREPKVAVRSTGDHQDSAEGDRDDRDCETDPPEHRLQAAYPHRSTLADARTAVERVDLGAEPQGEPSDAHLSNVSINGVRQTWQQLYESEREAHVALQGYRTMISDLDRNAGGRHEGDYDSFASDNGGISAGNPHLTTGQIIGYDIGGREYVVPEPRERGTLWAWVRAAGGVR